MSKKTTPMTKDAARRIQSHADRTGTNEKFKRSAQSAADTNADAKSGAGGDNTGGNKGQG